MRTAGVKAVDVASRIAKAARKAEKEATKVNKGEVAAALAQLKQAKRTKAAAASSQAVSKAASQADSRPVRPAYVPHNDFPLGHVLSKTNPAYLSRTPTGKDKFPDTLDVVSESLCDDIINYIGPDLDKHKGCDIIDINPGACLWSQKLHNYLKPRCHLLLEPDNRYLDPFIQPLLDQQGSAYRHSTLAGVHPKSYWETYDRIFDDHLLPERVPLPEGDPRLRQPNNSLLVVGNLVRRFHDHRASNNAVHFPSLWLLHLAEAAQINRLYQRYGLVRTLLWVPEDIKTSILPDSILFRQGVSVNLDAAFNMVEIASTDRALVNRVDASKKTFYKQRQDELDTMSARRVLARMQERGMTMPEPRRPIMHQRALTTLDQSLEEYDPIRLPQGETLKQCIKSHETQLHQLDDIANLTPKEKKQHVLPKPRFKFTRVSEEVIVERDRNRLALFIDSWGAQIALEEEYNATKEDMSEQVRSDIGSELAATSGRVIELFDRLTNIATKVGMTVLLDEVWAVCRRKPMMQWDHRPFEPLTVSENEFYPRIPMQLLEFTPKPEALGNDLMDANKSNRLRRGLVKTLFTHPSSPLLESIDRLGHGARDLISAEFKDTRTGGRLEPKQLLTKDISAEQINALARAYIEWPFRPLGSDALEEEAIVM